jgi:hypothetical protein
LNLDGRRGTFAWTSTGTLLGAKIVAMIAGKRQGRHRALWSCPHSSLHFPVFAMGQSVYTSTWMTT